jgi:hypothetical protein
MLSFYDNQRMKFFWLKRRVGLSRMGGGAQSRCIADSNNVLKLKESAICQL